MNKLLLIISLLFCFTVFSQNTSLYVIQKGDTYFSIAEKHQMTVDELLKINSIKIDNPLIAGVSLFIVNHNSKNNKFHIVNKGETLYSISKKYKINIDTLKLKNNLHNNIIHTGQLLKID